MAARVALEEEANWSLLAAWQPTGGGAAGTTHRDRLAAPEHPGATIDTPYPVAIVGVGVAARNNLDQADDDGCVGAPQGLDRPLRRARAGLGARGEDQGAQHNGDSRN